MNRRGFLAGILAAGVAPAFVGSKILMPVKRIITPWDHQIPWKIWYQNTELGRPPIIIDAANEVWNFPGLIGARPTNWFDDIIVQ